MAVRQNTQPVAFDMTRRPDNVSVLTSTTAGVVCPVTYAPLLRGDSASGRVQMNLQLAEMTRPVNNAILARAQAWFVPRPALPLFTGVEDFVRSYEGKAATRLNNTAVAAVDLYATLPGTSLDVAETLTKMGIVNRNDSTQNNTDIVDAYSVIWNFRRDAHSSKIPRCKYHGEGSDPHRSGAYDMLPAFWPTNRMMSIKPDYETALVTGSMELDFSAGQIPVAGITRTDTGTGVGTVDAQIEGAAGHVDVQMLSGTNGANIRFDIDSTASGGANNIYADMAAETLTTTLASIDKARTTNAFAKMQAMMAGSDYSGFNTDDVIVSSLMQGYMVPEGLLNRPMLLDSKTVVFGSIERHATDGANLDDSVTTGTVSVSLSINIPKAEYGGIMMTTVEIMSERLYERQTDPYLQVTSVDDLPNALRDIQRIEPVDSVTNDRVDSRHSTKDGTFGFEPMNNKWRREFTRLGGEFLQTTPGTPNAAQRTAIWQADIVDPALTSDHWLCPSPFPQDVFAVPANDVCEVAARQVLTVTGITQFGDELVEDNGEFVDVDSVNA